MHSIYYLFAGIIADRRRFPTLALTFFRNSSKTFANPEWFPRFKKSRLVLKRVSHTDGQVPDAIPVRAGLPKGEPLIRRVREAGFNPPLDDDEVECIERDDVDAIDRGQGLVA